MKFFTNGMQKGRTFYKNHNTQINATASVVGALVAVGFAIKGTIKVIKGIKELKEAKAEMLNESIAVEDKKVTPEEVKLTPKEYITIILPQAIIPALGLTISIAATVSSYNITKGLMVGGAALLASNADHISEISKLKSTIVEKLGDEEGAKVVADAAFAEHTKENPLDVDRIWHGSHAEIPTDCVVILEPLTNQKTYCRYMDIEKAANKFAHDLLMNDDQSLNDWLDYLEEFGIEQVDMIIGDQLGWNSAKELFELGTPMVTKINTTRGEMPAYVINYKTMPFYDFRSYYR